MKSYFCDRCKVEVPNPQWEVKALAGDFVVHITVRRVEKSGLQPVGNYADFCTPCFHLVVQQALKEPA